MRIVSLLFLVFAGVTLFALYKNSRFGVASPEYRVTERDGDFEIREYPTLSLVSTSMAGPDVTEGASFMRLFRYISGSNQAGEKIDMTTPVITSQEGGKQRMSFIVPPSVAAAGPPRATGEDVELGRLEGGLFAAYRFSGSWDVERFENATRKLYLWISKRNLVATGDPMIANYDPPFTPSFVRRNEILVRLGSGQGSEQLSRNP